MTRVQPKMLKFKLTSFDQDSTRLLTNYTNP